MNKTRAHGARKILWTLSGLVALTIAAANLPADYSLPTLFGNSADTVHGFDELQPANESFTIGWRYTKDGWQNRTDWQEPSPVSKPALHPAIVGLLQLLLSLAALIGFSTSKYRFARAD